MDVPGWKAPFGVSAVYFETGTGWSEVNSELLSDILMIARSPNTGLEIVAADWNMSEHQVGARCPWKLAFPSEPTLHHPGGVSTIDGFAIDDDACLLRPSVRVCHDHSKGPHKPVQLCFPPDAGNVWKVVPATKIGHEGRR